MSAAMVTLAALIVSSNGETVALTLVVVAAVFKSAMAARCEAANDTQVTAICSISGRYP